ncbi:MAG: 23S rRNA pseudouridine(955/2504/2580) synthase RluC [Fluviicoccus sp.]|uniref:23S rRNA pseudouridine(955/2504/2580) synthase RluC n=1 Tax=Fluviicoccus sp. TaxID=2003552 RepID=UPI00271A9196|nr:23S rRNA pseudouridine(955/2504/2580) synthase RluC [Fluviicoccus sp.]MDO8329005.1 23S rRNA pseudouridine(955/2504/2580) synthase RluC [Fluviicoccus sp.]
MNQPDTSSAVRFITVKDGEEGQRIDNFLITALKGAPRTLVYRIVRKGEVRVNKGRIKAEYRIQAGDVIRVPPIRLPEVPAAPTPSPHLAQQLRERIMYHQDGLIVVNKPAGLAVHGGSNLPFGLIEALRVLFPEKEFLELVHRLDRDTSGLLLVSEKRSVLRDLHEQLRQGRIRKTYVALLEGNLKGGQHKVTAPLHKSTLPSGERIVRVRDDGKPSETVFRVIERFGHATLVEASPLTGRTHQIRVHAQYLGHPILGDEKYGHDDAGKAARSWGLNRLFLHARDLTLTLSGKTEPLKFSCPPAPELQAVLEYLRLVKA